MEPQIVQPEPEPAEVDLAYVGFNKLAGQLKGKVTNPAAVAAAIGRKKYGKAKFQAMAKAGKRKGKKSKDKVAASYDVGMVVGLSNECGVVQAVFGDDLIVHTATGTKTVKSDTVRAI